MALQTQIVDINFDQGIDTRDDGFLRTGKFDEMINVERQKAGGIVKRNGFEQVSTGFSSPLKLFEIKNNLVVLDQATIGIKDLKSSANFFPNGEVPFGVTYSNGKYICAYYKMTIAGIKLYLAELSSDGKNIASTFPITYPNANIKYNTTNFFFVEHSSGKYSIVFEGHNNSTGDNTVEIISFFGTSIDSSQSVDNNTDIKIKSVCGYVDTLYVTYCYVLTGNIIVKTKSYLVATGSVTLQNTDSYTKVAGTNISGEAITNSCADNHHFSFADYGVAGMDTVVAYSGPFGDGWDISNSTSGGNASIYVNGNLVLTTLAATPVTISTFNDGTLASVLVGGTQVAEIVLYEENISIEYRNSKCITNFFFIDESLGYSQTPLASNLFLRTCTNLLASGVTTDSGKIFLPVTYMQQSDTDTFIYRDIASINFGTEQLVFDILTYTIVSQIDIAWAKIVSGNRINGQMYVDPNTSNLFPFSSDGSLGGVLNQGSAYYDSSYHSFQSIYGVVLSQTNKNNTIKNNISIVENGTSQNISAIQLTEMALFTGLYLGVLTENENFEVGFFQVPIIVSKSTDVSGGSISAGTYNYKFTYSYVDMSGNLWESSPTDVQNISVTGSSKYNQFVVSFPSFTNKTGISINVYRTKSNESIFYKILSQKVVSGSNSTITDTINDSQIANGLNLNIAGSGETIYTTGGIFPNDAIGACFSITATKNRVFVASSEDRTRMFFSKEKITGYGFEFSGLQYIDCNGGIFEGDITGIVGLDEKIILGKDKYLLGVYGDGPNAAGGGQDFSIPQLISTDVGISDKNSVVIVPDGIMFKSKKGIYHLGRDLKVSYRGILADKYAQDSVYSAMMASSKNLVFFGITGKLIVHDYLLQNWFIWKGNSGLIDSVSSCIVNDVLYVLTTTGRILRQNATYQDQLDSVPTYENIITEIETSWLEVGSVNGFQRLRRVMFLGHCWGSASFSVKFSRDYDTTVLETHTLTVTDTGGKKMQMNMHIANQKSSTTKINIKEAGSGTANKISLSGMSYEIGIKKGTAKVSSSNKI